MMKNIQNKNGFALVETLIVAVFIMVIFAMMFANFYPLVGEYEKADNYDTVDSKYIGYWIRKMLLDKDPSFTTLNSCSVAGDNRCRLITDCSSITNVDDKAYCESLFTELGIQKIYVTDYNLANFKTYVTSSLTNDREFLEYIKYLPKYDTTTSSCYTKRIIYEYIKNPYSSGKSIKSYGTIAVAVK